MSNLIKTHFRIHAFSSIILRNAQFDLSRGIVCAKNSLSRLKKASNCYDLTKFLFFRDIIIYVSCRSCESYANFLRRQHMIDHDSIVFTSKHIQSNERND